MKLRDDQKVLCSKVRLIVVESGRLLLLQIRLSKRRFSLEQFEEYGLPDRENFAAWARALSAAFLKASPCFRRGSVFLLLPHFAPLIKHVEIPPVLDRFERETVGQAFEMEASIREKDYAWDCLPIKAGGSEFYVFAEKRAILRPFLNLFLSTDICPNGAILPVFADFLAMANDGKVGHSLKVDISDEFTVLGFSGGDRIFVRYLNFGWNWLLNLLAKNFGETLEEVRRRLEKFLVREENPIKKEETILQNGFRDFCNELQGHIRRTELHYANHLSGKHFTQISWVASMAHCQRLQEFWLQKYGITGSSFEIGRFLAIPRGMRKRTAAVGSATWLRIFHSMKYFAFRGAGSACPFVGEKLRERAIRRQSRRLLLEGVSLFSMAFLLGSFYRLGELKFLRAELAERQSQFARMQIRSQEFNQLQSQMEKIRRNFQLQNRICGRQNAFVKFLASLESALAAATNCWIDRLTFPEDGAVSISDNEISIAIAGRFFVDDPEKPERQMLLLRQFEALVENLHNSGLIRRMEDISIDPLAGHIAKFRLTIVVDAHELL